MHRNVLHRLLRSGAAHSDRLGTAPVREQVVCKRARVEAGVLTSGHWRVGVYLAPPRWFPRHRDVSASRPMKEGIVRQGGQAQ